MIWCILGALVAYDAARGRGELTAGVLAGLALLALTVGVSFPLWLGAMLVVGMLKGLGAQVDWRLRGLPIITTPEPRALEEGRR